MLTVLLAPLVATATLPAAPARCLTIVKPAMVPPFGESLAAADQADAVTLILDRAAGPPDAAAEYRLSAAAQQALPAAMITKAPCAADIQTARPTAALATG